MTKKQMDNKKTLAERKCRDCGELKPLSDFSKKKSGPLGYANQCKACRCLHRKMTDSYLKERIRKHQYRHNSATYYTDELIHRLRTAEKCCYCGKPFVDQTGHAMQLTLDHVYSSNSNTDHNIVICHRACNSSKGKLHIYDYFQASATFTDELFAEFLKDFIGRLYKVTVTDADIPYLTAELKAESEEFKRGVSGI
ncbi:hypothetical protein [Lysinibacillus sp.]|uniref:HNH endonuclease n=1 Tax=Lysinibacillus sp. TaxID=1869345 RepID=UPI00289DA098|nr:hypothetical protein [Lysinibacillus sp.]